MAVKLSMVVLFIRDDGKFSVRTCPHCTLLYGKIADSTECCIIIFNPETRKSVLWEIKEIRGGYGSMVEHLVANQMTRVRFPVPAQK
jgi:hypothetical protein